MSETEKTLTKAAGLVSCIFAYPGTYGHECGKPAFCYFVKKSDITKSGEFFAARCEECAMAKGGENRNVIRRESIHGQVNDFK